MATIYQFPVDKMEIDLSEKGGSFKEYKMSPLPGSLLEQARCSEEEKKELIPLYIELLSLHYCYRDEGPEAFNDVSVHSGKGFLNEAFSLFLSGMKPKKLEMQLLRMVRKKSPAGIRMLEILMIQQTVISIAAGNHPSRTNELLTALIGFDNPGSLLEVVLNALSSSSSGEGGEGIPFLSCHST